MGHPIMAKALTGSFYLTETVALAALNPSGAPRTSVSIDLGAYVNVPTGQAIAIESVDFVYQVSSDYGSAGVNQMLAGNGGITVQLTDLNPGAVFVRADDQSLVASGSLNIDTVNNIASHTSDLYPDNFGPAAMSEAFMVVNDAMYLTAGNDGATIGTAIVYVTARIRCRVVKLSTVDWMALAIQSTSSDTV
jgi:hypothetical protein